MRRHDPILWIARVLAVAVLLLAIAMFRDMVMPAFGVSHGALGRGAAIGAPPCRAAPERCSRSAQAILPQPRSPSQRVS